METESAHDNRAVRLKCNAVRKGEHWTEEEHMQFLRGLAELGKGSWRGISKSFVPTRSPAQVASHAQKFFLKTEGRNAKRLLKAGSVAADKNTLKRVQVPKEEPPPEEAHIAAVAGTGAASAASAGAIAGTCLVSSASASSLSEGFAERMPASRVDSANAATRGEHWTPEEHARFLLGLKELGKGAWRAISRQYVLTRSPTQVASHSQKYFLKLAGVTKGGRGRQPSGGNAKVRTWAKISEPQLSGGPAASSDVNNALGGSQLSGQRSVQPQMFPHSSSTQAGSSPAEHLYVRLPALTAAATATAAAAATSVPYLPAPLRLLACVPVMEASSSVATLLPMTCLTDSASEAALAGQRPPYVTHVKEEAGTVIPQAQPGGATGLLRSAPGLPPWPLMSPFPPPLALADPKSLWFHSLLQQQPGQPPCSPPRGGAGLSRVNSYSSSSSGSSAATAESSWGSNTGVLRPAVERASADHLSRLQHQLMGTLPSAAILDGGAVTPWIPTVTAAAAAPAAAAAAPVSTRPGPLFVRTGAVCKARGSAFHRVLAPAVRA